MSGRPIRALREQRLKSCKGRELVGMSPIFSGREGNGTLNGKFSIIEKASATVRRCSEPI